MAEILIVDFGSQYSFRIAKTIRKLGYYCEIVDPYDVDYDQYVLNNVKLLILSGGPQSVYDGDLYTETIDQIGRVILDPTICVLGICFGLQYICHFLNGGKVIPGRKGEYGKAYMTVNIDHSDNPLISWMFKKNKSRSKFHRQSLPPITTLETQNFPMKKRGSFLRRFSLKDNLVTQRKNDDDTDIVDVNEPMKVWMSHKDVVVSIPPSCVNLGSTSDCKYSMIGSKEFMIYGMQFHPEVHHTYKGKYYFKALINESGCERNWGGSQRIEECEKYIKSVVSDTSNVILGLSGGVDSTVVAFLLKRFLKPDQLKCVLVDHGMMRKNEIKEIEQSCQQSGIELNILDASTVFISRLKGVTDPEKKRKIIGRYFVECFEDYVKISTTATIGTLSSDNWMLAQGTIYPDVVESAKAKHSKNQHLIKSHHNVGGLPEKMGMKLVEPLRHLFKNEVRDMGKKLGIPDVILSRHPFPGPGLGIRIIGEITREKIDIVQKADKIFIDELRKQGLYHKISQAYAGLLDCKSVGVVGDQRRYGWIVCLRAVETKDFMTATAYQFTGKHSSFLDDVSTKIVNSISQVSRVMYDVTSKPPGTIELE